MEPFTTGAADAQAAFVPSYIQGRFDPNRPYIQMVVPAEEMDTPASEDRFKPFIPLPTRPTPPTSAPSVDKTPKPEICNESQYVNGTWVNGTNATDCTPPTKKTNGTPTTALFMLADGITLYSVAKEDAKKETLLNGAYELAYVAHRPVARTPSRYPIAQFVDYTQLYRDKYSLFRSPYPATGYYEPVYIYRPVYPAPSRSYDVYYYLPSDERKSQEQQTNSNAAPDNTEKEEAEERFGEESSEEIARTEVLARDPAPSAVKEEASEIAMANAAGEDANDQEALQQEALLNALSSEIQTELQRAQTAAESPPRDEDDPITKVAKEKLAQLMGQDEDNGYWENELDRISNKDLINAVEIVLQQLNSRLSNKQ